MSRPPRPISFVLASSSHGSLIVSRNDFHRSEAGTYGVGHQILESSSYDPVDVQLMLALLDFRRRYHGEGVLAVDGGANIGVHTVEWARHLDGWGRVLAFEAQEVVFYALAGNIALNNCLNARARLAVLGAACGEIRVPQPDYFAPASFGSLEVRPRPQARSIGQPISYDPQATVPVPMVSIDSLAEARLDLLKLDVEGMEAEVLDGARDTLRRCRPILFVEVLKSDAARLSGLLQGLGYRLIALGLNLLAVHREDPTLRHLEETEGQLRVVA